MILMKINYNKLNIIIHNPSIEIKTMTNILKREQMLKESLNKVLQFDKNKEVRNIIIIAMIIIHRNRKEHMLKKYTKIALSLNKNSKIRHITINK